MQPESKSTAERRREVKEIEEIKEVKEKKPRNTSRRRRGSDPPLPSPPLLPPLPISPCITHFPQHHTLPRSRSPRHIRSPPLQRLPTEQCKCKRLLRVPWYAKLIRRSQTNPRQRRLDLRHQQWIVRPAPRHNQFQNSSPLRDKPMNRIHNRKRRQNRGSANHVLGPRPPHFRMHQHVPHIFFPILFAPRRLRRTFKKIFIPQQCCKQTGQYFASLSDMRVPIERLPPICEMPHQRIDHHVSRPDIERKNIADFRTPGNHSNIRNSTDIERRPSHARIAIKQIIDKRHKRRPLSARSHIGGPKISHSRNPRPPRDH